MSRRRSANLWSRRRRRTRPPRRSLPETKQHTPKRLRISFEKVSKSFGSFDVLKEGELLREPGGDVVHSGAKRGGQVGFAADAAGISPRPDSGKIMVAGENICAFNEKQLQAIRRKVSMVFQSGALVRLDQRGGECGVSAAGARRYGGRPDRANREGPAGDGGGCGDGPPCGRAIYRQG